MHRTSSGVGRRLLARLVAVLAFMGADSLLALPPPYAMPAARAAVTLAPSACPMAHCDAHLSGDEGVSIPTSTVTSAWTVTTTGMIGGIGLGCTVGGGIAVCTGTNATHS